MAQAGIHLTLVLCNARKIYAPEQYSGDPIDEKVDVFSMGHIIYSILTQMLPFFDIADQDDVGVRVLNQERPFVDGHFRTGTYIETRLVEIMEEMWAHNASDRPEIFEVVRFLKDTRETYRTVHSHGVFSNWIERFMGWTECEL